MYGNPYMQTFNPYQQLQLQQQQMQQSPYADIPSLADIGKDMANKS